jgi:adenylate cyclase
MSADIVGYSRLMGMDSDTTVHRLEEHRASIASLIEEHCGRLVNFVGDNFLAEFSSASSAVECALSIQSALAKANAAVDPQSKMLLRIGLHLGEVRAEGERLFGQAINIAARIEGTAEPGGVCISEAVQQQIVTSPQFSLEDLGLQEFKNIKGSTRVYRVRPSEETAPEAVDPRDSDLSQAIAVLPFANMSADADQDYFGDGMAEEIINALAQIPGVRVIARTSAFRFKGTSTDVRSIGQILGASVVVEGSVRRSGNRLRITAQLVDTAAGHHLWSEVFDRDADDVFAIQDEIARRVVETARPKLFPPQTDSEPIIAAATDNQQAYELYLRAGTRLNHANRWDNKLAVTMLEEATELDPDFSEAWARLGSACCWLEFAFEPDAEWILRAEQAVERSLAIDQDNATAESVRGRLLWSPRRGFQHLEALSALERSLQLQPGGHEARLWHSLILLHIGLFDGAESGLERVVASDPENAMAVQSLGQLYAFSGRYEQASKCHSRALEIDPGNYYSMSFDPAAQLYAGDLDTSDRALDKARGLLPDEPLLDATEALLWARRGESQRAEDALARGEQSKRSVGHLHHCDHFSACALALLGDFDAAVARLTQAADTGFPNYPLFRDDTHFQRIQQEHLPMQNLMQDLENRWHGFRRAVAQMPKQV